MESLPPKSGSLSRAGGALPVDGGPDGTPVRVVEFAPGQRVQATVVEAPGDGTVTIGVLGAKVPAFSRLPLEVGRSYDFTVTATKPRIVLAAARPVVLPDAAAAAAAGKIGPSPVQLAGLLKSVVDALPALGQIAEPATAGGATPLEVGGDRQQAIGAAVRELVSGKVTAENLQTLHRLLGHDQEARVLRLPDRAPNVAKSEQVALRQTMKAVALEFLERAAAAPDESDHARVQVARDLVEGLSGMEAENARRTEHGSATWLPLPASPDGAMRDARMFLLRGDGESDRTSKSSDEQAVTVVLLLDMTKLGAMRVDVMVNRSELAVDFEVVETSASIVIRDALAELQEELESSAFEIQHLRVRQAAGQQLSIADLCAPPAPGDPRGLVDVHA